MKDRERLRVGLEVLAAAVAQNRDCLVRHLAALSKQAALFELDLDTSAWDATQDQVVPTLNNPALHRRISAHFAQLRSLEKLSFYYLDLLAGIGGAMGGSEHTRDALKTHLLGRAGGLFNAASELENEIRTAVLGLATTQRPSIWERIRKVGGGATG